MAFYSFNNSAFFFLLYLIGFGVISSAQLSPTFYLKTCPKALWTIKSVVTKAVISEHRMGASLLRLHFHDCFVNGCDASVLLDDTSSFTGEKNARPNKDSIRGFEVIDTIKSQLESVCPGVVSCADILAVAARDSVVALRGPAWIVQLGRRDSTTASLSDAETNIPSPLLDLSDIVTAFANKGFTAKEMVALLAAHTIGQARCFTFRNRLYNESLIEESFATSVKLNCPISLGDNNLTALDVSSPLAFDNGYFNSLVNNKGLLHSDQQLFSGGSTDAQVDTYKTNALNFYFDFAAAIVKMGNLNVLTGTTGQIRTNCAKVN